MGALCGGFARVCRVTCNPFPTWQFLRTVLALALASLWERQRSS